MSKIVALNHKMNFLSEELDEYLEALNKVDTDNIVIIIPSSLYLDKCVKSSKFNIGCQNVYKELKGAYTGEVSIDQIKSLGVTYVLIGHSERRKIFKEDYELIRDKLKLCLDSDIKIIFCVGETLEERKDGNSYKVIDEQIDTAFADNDIRKIIIAYEPVWSIGTGVIPKLEEIEEMVNYIYNTVNEKYNIEPTILYGGSVDDNNITGIIDIDRVDGVLVGGASLNIEKTKNIIEKSN